MPYSHKDFTGRDLSLRTDMNGLTIVGSCFSHEKPDTRCFPEDMHDVTFINCNLDNCYIPPFNNTTKGCSRERFAVQNDLNDWIIDEEDNPVAVMDYHYFWKMGLPHPHPKDIPDAPVSRRVDLRDLVRNVRSG